MTPTPRAIRFPRFPASRTTTRTDPRDHPEKERPEVLPRAFLSCPQVERRREPSGRAKKMPFCFTATSPTALSRTYADVAELVDALDLGSSAERRGGSSPLIRTIMLALTLGQRTSLLEGGIMLALPLGQRTSLLEGAGRVGSGGPKADDRGPLRISGPNARLAEPPCLRALATAPPKPCARVLGTKSEIHPGVPGQSLPEPDHLRSAVR